MKIFTLDNRIYESARFCEYAKDNNNNNQCRVNVYVYVCVCV